MAYCIQRNQPRVFDQAISSGLSSSNSATSDSQLRVPVSSQAVIGRRILPRPLLILCFLLLALVTLANAANTRRTVVRTRKAGVEQPIQQGRMTSMNTRSSTCKVYRNTPLHVIMDRVCELCHEMYSHDRPNLRAECRANCFRSDVFRDCLAVFTPSEDEQSVEE